MLYLHAKRLDSSFCFCKPYNYYGANLGLSLTTNVHALVCRLVPIRVLVYVRLSLKIRVLPVLSVYAV